MKVDGCSDDKSTFWSCVLTRDPRFVMILLVHGCWRVYLRYSALLMMSIITMLHELGMNSFVSVMFANADKSCKAFDYRLCKLEILLCGMGTSLKCWSTTSQTGWYAKVQGQHYASGTFYSWGTAHRTGWNFRSQGGGIVSNTWTNGEVCGNIGKAEATLNADSSCNSKKSQADGFLAAWGFCHCYKAGRCIPGGTTLPKGKVSAVELEGSILPE